MDRADAPSEVEQRRIAALMQYDILDSPREPEFNEIVELASRLCAVPISTVTLVDTERQWFKARVGLDLDETPRGVAFCAHVILGREPLVVPDAAADPRFSDNPLVTGPPYLRFYAGIPLVAQGGHVLGTLNVMDRVPRVLTDFQREALAVLAHQVVARLELRRSLAELERARAELLVAKAELEQRIEERTRSLAQASAAQTEAESLYRSLWETTTDAVLILDERSIVQYANPATVRVFGHPPDALVGSPLGMLQPERLRGAHVRGFARYLETGVRRLDWRATETIGLRRDGTEVEIEISFSELALASGRRFVGFVRDISERKDQQRRIERLSRVRAVTSGISSAMVRIVERDALLDEACRVAVHEGVFPAAWIEAVDPSSGSWAIVASRAAEVADVRMPLLWGTALAADLVRTRPAGAGPMLVGQGAPADSAHVPVAAALAARGLGSAAVLPLRVAHSVVAVLVLAARDADFFDSEEAELLEWLGADLSFALEAIEKSKRLEYLAYYDSLTGIANATLFQNQVGQFVRAAAADGRGVCVVALDLERFTHINETIGHAAADEMLRQVAARLEQHVTPPCSLARIAGDTFAVASKGELERIATSLPDRVFEALEEPFRIEGHEIAVRAQAGIALYPHDADGGEGLLKRAEAALKLAKSSEERRTYYSREVHARVEARFELERELRSALAEGQFALRYQPRVDLVSGEMVGAEALLRWQHPVRGLIAPGEFIELAEQTGLIVPIGEWVLDAACVQQSAWTATGLGVVPIAVNLSSVQFQRSDLVQIVRRALAGHALDPGSISFELTESSVMRDPATAAATLHALRRIGVKLALDDFGTGYSSFAHLKRFPFDTIKIDRSFVCDVTQNAEDAAIATAIIAMAHRLGLKVVAEGIETEGQLHYLRAQGCDEMQGYYFSAAVDAPEFEALLRGGRRMQLPQTMPLEAKTLLVVDNDDGIRAALVRVLRRDGYRILTASSGAEALETLATNPVQVIITDQRMPEMSGTELLAIVRQMYPDTMRIVLSGYTELETVTDAVNRGSVFKFLTKPWDDELLRQHVRDAFRRFRPERRGHTL